MIEHLNKLDLYSDSYLLEPKCISEPDSDLISGFKAYSWIRLLVLITEKYVNSIVDIQKNFLFAIIDEVIPRSMIDISEVPIRNYKLLHMIISDHSIISDSYTKHSCRLYPDPIHVQLPYATFNTLDLIALTKTIMNRIDTMTGVSNFEIAEKVFTAPKDAPLLGSGIMKQ